MNASIPQSRRSLPFWLSVVVWLSAFLSPTAYFLLLLLANKFQIPRLPAMFVWALFLVIPVVALLICESVVWFLQQDGGSQAWLDAFHAVGDVAPVRNHSCDSANDSCDGDWIRSVTIFLTKSLEGERADHAACGFERVGPPDVGR